MTDVAGVRHLYVHLPFCATRCGYCDFVTVVGRRAEHGAYTEALAAELALRDPALEQPLETIFLGGGTPTFTAPDALGRVLRALPPASEVTVEANPETVSVDLAELLRDAGASRVSLGAQSFEPRLLAVLDRRAGPDHIRRAVQALRDAGFDNVSLDLLYGIPGQTVAELESDLVEALALEPEHLSCYELEAKPGTRFARAWGRELERQAEAMEGYLELVVSTLESSGYRWYETSNFCLGAERSGGRDLRARHNLNTWRGGDYVGLGVGAVSTVADERRRTTPSLGAYLAALGEGRLPPAAAEILDAGTRRRERLMLGLRLDEPVRLRDLDPVLDRDGLDRMERLGLVERGGAGASAWLALTRRGRFLGGGVTVELLA